MGQIELFRASRAISDPTGDLVFVHGLGGDHTKTWTPEDSVGKGDNEKEFISYFPAVLAADFPTCNVWALSYSAVFTEWSNNPNFNELPRHCVDVLNYLGGKGIGQRPVIFVCHSLGGIVVKEILHISSDNTFPRMRSVFENTKAVSFIATPHKGSKWADLIGNINKVLPFVRPSVRIAELKEDNVYLEQLSAWYRQMSADGKIETQAFYEKRKTSSIEVVPHYSANPDVVGCHPIGINKNHIEIARPKRKSDELYVSLSGLINGHFYGGSYVSGLETAQNSIPPQTIVIGIVRKGKKVLMVRRRNPIDKLTWQFVAGRLKVNQELEEECIIREVAEETGVRVKVLHKIGEKVDGDVPYKRIYYALEYLDGEASNNDEIENSDVSWVSISSVDRFVTTKIDERVRLFLGI